MEQPIIDLSELIMWIVIILIIIVGIYLFVQVVMPLILRKKATDVMMGRR